ncbi:MAG TPA: hypothetical protein VMQ61_07440 [Thermoanaerobaculia bacterium]|nr:hypothetical protein [Thermoanaerobaculia bacterium]
MAKKPAKKIVGKTARSKRLPALKPGTYADGTPLHEIRYLECKLILRPNHFTSRQSLFDFTKIIRRPAAEHEIDFSTKGFVDAPLQIREVLFMDTAANRLYNNAFILRRRILYEEGFPTADPEIVFKFRHPDLQTAAQTDVRPQIVGDYRIKFKAEALPLKHELGGTRLLFSHNVQFPLSHVLENNLQGKGDPISMASMMRVFPPLQGVKASSGEKLELVSDTIVEEVLQDLGILDFGEGMSAKANVALWRVRGDHRPLIGEFAFEVKFKRQEDLKERAMARAQAFFVALQLAAKDWIDLGATKTGVVYRLKGNPPQAHE